MPAERYLFYISQNYSFAILRPVQTELRRLGRQVKWFVEGNNVRLDYFKEDESRLNSIEQINLYQPDAVLYPADIAPNFLPGINVSIFHGFESGKLDNRGKSDHFKMRNCFDLYCTQGPNTTAGFKAMETKHSHFRVIETGWCALDPLFSATTKRDNNSASSTKKQTILMCSTFSRKYSCAPLLFETIKKLSQSGRWQWIIQFHPKMNTETVEQYKSLQSDHLTFAETDDVIPLLQEADVMVCDTSSVLLMFLMQHKPVVTFNNNTPNDYLMNITSADLLEETIEQALMRPEDVMQKIQHFISQNHPYQDGKSAQRLVAAIDLALSKKHELTKKPFDFFRWFRIRKKLNYWKLW